MSYSIYYKNDKGNYITYNGHEIKEINDTLTGRNFQLLKSIEKTEENLKIYYDKYYEWSQEIKLSFSYIKMDYLNSYNHIYSALHLIKKMCEKNYYNHKRILRLESKYIELPYNGGLMYCKPSKKAHYYYSNDKNNFYSEIMGNPKYEFYFPKSEGKETKINSIDDIKYYGMYHIKILPKNENAKKIFSFTSSNWYYYYDILTVLNNKEYFEYELIDCDINAYIYENDCMVKSSDIFGGWLKKLSYLKSKFPENKLIKELTRAWGVLSMKNKIKIEEKELLENIDKYEGYEIIDTHYNEESTIHILENINEQPYKHNIRLKGWITSYARYEIAKTILLNIDNVIRVQTDSITYNIDIEPNEDEKREEKSTGYIKFKTCNSYFHKCRECKEYFKYKDFIKHSH